MPAGYGYGASQGLEDVLKRLYLESQMKQQADQFAANLQERRRENEIAQGLRNRELGQGDTRLAQDREEFQFRRGQAGIQDQRYADEAPLRAANLRLHMAQATNLEGEPARLDAQRAFEAQRDLTRHQYEMQEIGASGANALRVARTNHPAGPADQPTTNEVDDTLSLIDQIAKDPALGKSVGPLDQYDISMVADPTGVNRFKALHNQLVGKMSLAQAGKLKGQGQISDKERALLAAAATALSRGLGEKDYRAELAKIQQQFTRMKGGVPTAAPGGQVVPKDPLGIR